MALTQVSSAGIKNAEVKTEDILDNAVTGAKVADNLDIPDSNKIRFGTGNDLEIFHNGTNSIISNQTGDLSIRSDNNIVFQDYGVNETFAKFVDNGAVELYYDNVKKLETTSSGATLSGYLNVPTGDSGYGSAFGDNVKAGFGDVSDLQIYHDGSHSYIADTGTGDIVLKSDTTRIINAAGTENIARFIEDGAVELYHNSLKMCETTANGLKVQGPEGGDGIIQIYADEGDDDADFWRLHSEADSSLFSIQNYKNGSAWEKSIACIGDGAVELYHDNAKKFETTSTGCMLRDGVKLTFGDDTDFQLYHLNGGYGYLRDFSGKFYLQTNEFIVTVNAGDETMLTATANGAVNLYYDNVKKIETSNGGVIVAGSVEASGNLSLPDDGEAKFGAGDDLKIMHTGGHNFITSASGKNLNLHISGAGTYVQLANSGVLYSHSFRPYVDDTYDIGSSSARWDDIYATNSSIQTSDRNEKNTIVDTDLGLSFVNKLKPVSYKFNGKTRTHYGLIAQDVETTLSDISKSTTDFAGFIKEDLPDQLYTDRDTIPEGKKEGDVKTPAHTTYGLRYNEFISPLIKAVQELSAEVETLKTKVAALEAK